MDVSAAIADSLSGWISLPGAADTAALTALVADAPIQLPAEYLDLLRLHDGGEGHLGAEPSWFRLWPAAEVLRWNREYEVPEWLPGFFGLGSNGGGEMLALDCRGEPPWPVVIVPFIAPEPRDAVVVADTFVAFVRLLGRQCPDGGEHAQPAVADLAVTDITIYRDGGTICFRVLGDRALAATYRLRTPFLGEPRLMFRDQVQMVPGSADEADLSTALQEWLDAQTPEVRRAWDALDRLPIWQNLPSELSEAVPSHHVRTVVRCLQSRTRRARARDATPPRSLPPAGA